MESNRSTQESSESSGSHQGLLAEFLDLWSKAEALAERLPQIIEMIGSFAVDAYRFGLEVAGFLGRHPGGTLAACFTAVCGSSLLGGWASGDLTGPSLKISAPVALVPIAIAMLHRLRQRESVEGTHPAGNAAAGETGDIGHRLELEAVKRRYLNTQSMFNGQTQPLDAGTFVAPQLAERVMRLRIGGYEPNLTLSRVTREGHGLKEVASRGSIPDSVKGRVALTWEELGHVEDALEEALEPFECDHFAVFFTLGTHHYLLVCLLPGTVTGSVKLEVSRAATGICERYVHGRGDSGPGPGGLERPLDLGGGQSLPAAA